MKQNYPFIYLNLFIKPENLEVNVSVTKQYVNFLDEEEIIEEISNLIKEKLLESNSSRVFFSENASNLNSSKSSINYGKIINKKIGTPKIIRVSEQRDEIENFTPLSSNKRITNSPFIPQKKYFFFNIRQKIEINDRLTSIQNLLDKLEENSHKGFFEVIQGHSYVGWVKKKFIFNFYIIKNNIIIIFKKIKNKKKDKCTTFFNSI
jgi:DNA mismatch repair protein MLH1